MQFTPTSNDWQYITIRKGQEQGNEIIEVSIDSLSKYSNGTKEISFPDNIVFRLDLSPQIEKDVVDALLSLAQYKLNINIGL